MRNKSSFYLLLVLSLVCFLWGFSVRGQETGPFCDLCSLITLVHVKEADFADFKNATFSRIDYLQSQIGDLSTQQTIALDFLSSLDSYLFSLYSMGNMESWEYEEYQGIVANIRYCLSTIGEKSTSVLATVSGISTSLNDVILTSSEYCSTCTAEGSGGSGTVEGDGTCCCNCPDYAPILQEMSDRIFQQSQSLSDMKGYLLSIKTTLDAWYVKWQAQDEKLTPLIDELKPMLSNIKKYYDDYYDSSFDSTAWSNIKKLVDGFEEKELLSDFDRLLNDYVGSSMNSAAWSAFAQTSIAWEGILTHETGFGDRTGAGTIKEFLINYSEQVARPIGSYTKSSDITTESEWLALNWFQRITAALGIMLFPKEKEEEEEDAVSMDQEEAKADEVKNKVSAVGEQVKGKVVSLYASYKSLFDSFKEIFPTDTFPTSVKIHGGWQFESAGGDAVTAIEPVVWLTDETPTLKTGCDMARSLFGLVWWVTGFFIMFGIIRGAYGFIVVIVEKVLLVVGSLGRAGGGGSSGV